MTQLLWNMVLFVMNVQWNETGGEGHCQCCEYIGLDSHIPLPVWWEGL